MGVLEFFTDVAAGIRQAVSTTTPLPVKLIGASGGGGPATIADGADVALGTTTDNANPSTTVAPATAIGLLKQLNALLGQLITTTIQEQTDIANTAGHTNTTVQILGSVLNPANTALVVQGIGANGAAIPVSATALPLPTGAVKESGGNLDALIVAISTLNAAVASLNLTLSNLDANVANNNRLLRDDIGARGGQTSVYVN